MRMVGNEVYIQRGETWSLDFAIRNKRGDPFMLLKLWENPYIAITVTAALYEQEGDFRETYWLDLNDRWVEQSDGSIVLEPIKKFIATEALALSTFSVDEAIANYGVANGGKMVLDGTSDFDITNYLFFVDPDGDDNRVYRYVVSYDNDNVVWEDYDFRVIKQFDTRNWMEQGYLYDIKILAGESVAERVASILNIPVNTWSDEELLMLIEAIPDEQVRAEMFAIYEEGMPLMPSYDTKSLILEPTRLYVSANIQGGVR